MESDAVNELRKIAKILLMAHGEALERELLKVMTTDDRRLIWVLLDGESEPKEIATKSAIPLKTVLNFLTVLRKAELIEGGRGAPPRKRIDYVPPGWLALYRPIETGTQETAEGGDESGKEGGGLDRFTEGNRPVEQNPSDGPS